MSNSEPPRNRRSLPAPPHTTPGIGAAAGASVSRRGVLPPMAPPKRASLSTLATPIAPSQPTDRPTLANRPDEADGSNMAGRYSLARGNPADSANSYAAVDETAATGEHASQTRDGWLLDGARLSQTSDLASMSTYADEPKTDQRHTLIDHVDSTRDDLEAVVETAEHPTVTRDSAITSEHLSSTASRERADATDPDMYERNSEATSVLERREALADVEVPNASSNSPSDEPALEGSTAIRAGARQFEDDEPLTGVIGTPSLRHPADRQAAFAAAPSPTGLTSLRRAEAEPSWSALEQTTAQPRGVASVRPAPLSAPTMSARTPKNRIAPAPNSRDVVATTRAPYATKIGTSARDAARHRTENPGEYATERALYHASEEDGPSVTTKLPASVAHAVLASSLVHDSYFESEEYTHVAPNTQTSLPPQPASLAFAETARGSSIQRASEPFGEPYRESFVRLPDANLPPARPQGLRASVPVTQPSPRYIRPSFAEVAVAGSEAQAVAQPLPIVLPTPVGPAHVPPVVAKTALSPVYPGSLLVPQDRAPDALGATRAGQMSAPQTQPQTQQTSVHSNYMYAAPMTPGPMPGYGPPRGSVPPGASPPNAVYPNAGPIGLAPMAQQTGATMLGNPMLAPMRYAPADPPRPTFPPGPVHPDAPRYAEAMQASGFAQAGHAALNSGRPALAPSLSPRVPINPPTSKQGSNALRVVAAAILLGGALPLGFFVYRDSRASKEAQLAAATANTFANKVQSAPTLPRVAIAPPSVPVAPPEVPTTAPVAAVIAASKPAILANSAPVQGATKLPPKAGTTTSGHPPRSSVAVVRPTPPVAAATPSLKEPKPVEITPVEIKPVEIKPVEVKPATKPPSAADILNDAL